VIFESTCCRLIFRFSQSFSFAFRLSFAPSLLLSLINFELPVMVLSFLVWGRLEGQSGDKRDRRQSSVEREQNPFPMSYHSEDMVRFGSLEALSFFLSNLYTKAEKHYLSGQAHNSKRD